MAECVIVCSPGSTEQQQHNAVVEPVCPLQAGG